VSVPRQKPSRPVAMGMTIERVFMPAKIISTPADCSGRQG
jgi:hypothetical protein